jgi:hypothetical protein
VARCSACGLVGPERQDGPEAKLAFARDGTRVGTGPLFTGVRGRGILRTSPKQISAKLGE